MTQKMEWVEGAWGDLIVWRLFGKNHEDACVLLSDGMWTSNTPPLVGCWNTLEAAQAAIVDALRRKYTELLDSLPDPPSDEIKVGDWVKRRDGIGPPLRVSGIGINNPAFADSIAFFYGGGFSPLSRLVKAEAPHVS